MKAEETIRYLHKLDELDEIIALNQRILSEIQDARKEGVAKFFWAICALDRKALKLQSLNYKNAQHISAKVLKHLKMSRKEKNYSAWCTSIKNMKH